MSAVTDLLARLNPVDAIRARLAARRGDELPVRTQSRTGAGHPTRLLGFDQAMVWVALALLLLGLVMVYSASVAMPDNPKFARYASTHFLTRHAVSIAIGFIAGLVALQVPIAVWEKWAPWLFIASLVLLVVVLVPFIGRGVNGARRWIPLGVTARKKFSRVSSLRTM